MNTCRLYGVLWICVTCFSFSPVAKAGLTARFTPPLLFVNFVNVLHLLADGRLQPDAAFFVRWRGCLRHKTCRSRVPPAHQGRQRQRVVIAAAMVLSPKLLIADEPVSMLDVLIRAEVLNLLRALCEQRDVSIVFITHDLGTVSYLTDRIAVMYLERIVETGRTEEVLRTPRHPYTQALLSVVPVPNPRLRRQRVILQGETPNPDSLPAGWRFHPR